MERAYGNQYKIECLNTTLYDIECIVLFKDISTWMADNMGINPHITQRYYDLAETVRGKRVYGNSNAIICFEFEKHRWHEQYVLRKTYTYPSDPSIGLCTETWGLKSKGEMEGLYNELAKFFSEHSNIMDESYNALMGYYSNRFIEDCVEVGRRIMDYYRPFVDDLQRGVETFNSIALHKMTGHHVYEE